MTSASFTLFQLNIKVVMSADPVLEEFPVEVMEDIDVVAKEWIQAQSDKEVVNEHNVELLLLD